MKTILVNATQHPFVKDQLNGFDEYKDLKEVFGKEGATAPMNFKSLPTKEEILEQAESIAKMAKMAGATHAMIGGAPYMMSSLEKSLKDVGIKPLYAFSERRSVEETDPTTGEVFKRAVFQHLGYVEV